MGILTSLFRQRGTESPNLQPCEGVDPRTVAAGVPGTLTNRAWYGMGHEAIVSGKLEPDKGWQQWTS